MLITVDRAEFLAAIKRATAIAPSDSPLDVLKGVLLETDSARKMLTVTSTNLSSTPPKPSQKCSNGSRKIRRRSAAGKTAAV